MFNSIFKRNKKWSFYNCRLKMNTSIFASAKLIGTFRKGKLGLKCDLDIRDPSFQVTKKQNLSVYTTQVNNDFNAQ